jgi:nucleoside 2-deoxyribosyltransferase
MRIYLAGAYSGTELGVADNIGIGLREAAALTMAGFAVYCPWLDFFIAIQAGGTILVEDFQESSMSFLVQCDAVLVVENPRNENSKGLKREIGVAFHKCIPIFHGRVELIEWAKVNGR